MLPTTSLPIISIPDINDAGRGRFSFQERLPGLRSTQLTIGESEVQIYTHGEELYDAMLSAIQRRSPIEKFAETMLLSLRPLL